MNEKFYMVIGDADTCPSYHAQNNVIGGQCYYGYTNDKGTAERYIRQFIHRRYMGYVRVSWELILALREKGDIEIEIIQEYDIQEDEKDPYKVAIDCTEQELYSFYETAGDYHDACNEELLIVKMDEFLKTFKTKTSKKIRRLLCTLAKELRDDELSHKYRTKKYYINCMRINGIR